MNYKYPDKDDRLTIELINTEYDGPYWEKSEAAVLEKAGEAIKALPEKDDRKRLLDLGCGKGRLIGTFARWVDEIVAVEPDSSRFSEAAEAGALADKLTGKEIDVRNGDITCVEEGSMFDVVLSSHVIQHITRDMARSMIEQIAAKLEEGGLLILTTTHTARCEDEFFREESKDGKRVSTSITGEEFDALFGTEGVLPVRIYSEDSVISMAEEAGFKAEDILCYHFKGHSSAAEDEEACEAGRKEEARDVLYIFRKKETLIDASIGYHFSFSIFDDEIGLRTDDESELRSSISGNFKDVVFYDSPESSNEQVFRDLKTGEEFLHGNGLPFQCFRALIKDYSFKMNGFEIVDSAVMVTVFSQTDTVQLGVSLSVRNATVDELVYLRQVLGNGAKFTNKDGREISVQELFKEISAGLNRKITDKEDTYLIEIKKYGNQEDVDTIIRRDSCKIYGMMCGDEGWRHVPPELAEERMVNQWGSREFVRLISFGTNSVLFNLGESAAARAYRRNRKNYDARFYGEMNPYFLMDSSFAGINHGVFFSMELVMVIKTICNRILSRQAGFYNRRRKNNVSRDIEKTKEYRGELLATLNKVENLEISEIGEMEKVLLESQQINPIIEKIKYLLDLVESELDLLYQNSTNRLINILTVLGLILSVAGVVTQVIPLVR